MRPDPEIEDRRGMIAKQEIRRLIKRVVYYSTVSLLLVVVLIGSWCIPPRLLEKVLHGVKAKFKTEIVRMDDMDTDEESISDPTRNESVRVMRGEDTT